MDKTDRPVLTMVLDEATLQNMDSLYRAMESCYERLNSQGIKSFDEISTHLCAEMVQQSSLARELILRQPPKELLGYLWSMHYLRILQEQEEQGDSYRPNKNLIEDFQFILEFVHASWSCCEEIADGRENLDESEVSEILATLKELRNTAMFYCMTKSKAIAAETGDSLRGDLSFRAMANWVTLRGRRYQVLEEEFLGYLLHPHDDALRKCYGIGADETAAGIQAIANSTRTGLSDATNKLERVISIAQKYSRPEDISCKFATENWNAMDDLLRGGICNLSRHTELTAPLLEDLSYSPGTNTEFLAEGELCGTPLRTLPSLVKPGIKLDGDYYITDGQFVRDVAYRCIQRGLCARDSNYREEWNRRQKSVVEEAFTKILSSQLQDATTYLSVYFRETGNVNWSETDLVIVMEDVLVVVESKAGVMAMKSPATDFDSYMGTVERLILSAYRQCERFVKYLASAKKVPIYELQDGRYVKVDELSLDDFRSVLPIGLTVESISPFSTCLNNLDAIAPLLGKHCFMSMSVDDLFVLRRFLPTTGEFFHYLEVRQKAGTVHNATLLDESEYLGSYISLNRFDTVLQKHRDKAHRVLWNSYADIVDKYFEGERAGRGAVPRQNYPAELKIILKSLDKKRPKGWLKMDAAIRNLSDEERDTLSKCITSLKATLGRHKYRRMLFFNRMPLQIWVCASGWSPPKQEVCRQAEVACLVTEMPMTQVLCLFFNSKRRLSNIACMSFAAPFKSRSDYSELERLATTQRARAISCQDLARIR